MQRLIPDHRLVLRVFYGGSAVFWATAATLMIALAGGYVDHQRWFPVMICTLAVAITFSVIAIGTHMVRIMILGDLEELYLDHARWVEGVDPLDVVPLWEQVGNHNAHRTD